MRAMTDEASGERMPFPSFVEYMSSHDPVMGLGMELVLFMFPDSASQTLTTASSSKDTA